MPARKHGSQGTALRMAQRRFPHREVVLAAHIDIYYVFEGLNLAYFGLFLLPLLLLLLQLIPLPLQLRPLRLHFFHSRYFALAEGFYLDLYSLLKLFQLFEENVVIWAQIVLERHIWN